METRGTRFKHARRTAGLTQREVAPHFGVDTGTISRWERGESPLALPTLEAAATLFAVDRVWLVFGEGNVPQPLPSVRPPSEVDAEDDEDARHEPHEGAA
jgi:transcriptional regulator with XRE-family HTH domain